MNRLQIQKSGGGQAAFDFLTAEDKGSVSGPNIDQDHGFKAAQLAALDDITEVNDHLSHIFISDEIFFMSFPFTLIVILIIRPLFFSSLKVVNQRDEEITRIATSIEELAQIFKELAVLVIDQGTILDRIDFNMESAVEHAKEGVKQLVTANDHQKNALPMRCIIVLVVLIAIMLIVLVVKNSPQKSSN